MSARDDEIRRVVAELDVHVAEVEADLAVLKALLADDEAQARKTYLSVSVRAARSDSRQSCWLRYLSCTGKPFTANYLDEIRPSWPRSRRQSSPRD